VTSVQPATTALAASTSAQVERARFAVATESAAMDFTALGHARATTTLSMGIGRVLRALSVKLGNMVNPATKTAHAALKARATRELLVMERANVAQGGLVQTAQHATSPPTPNVTRSAHALVMEIATETGFATTKFLTQVCATAILSTLGQIAAYTAATIAVATERAAMGDLELESVLAMRATTARTAAAAKWGTTA
jgi:hypothetical protein